MIQQLEDEHRRAAAFLKNQIDSRFENVELTLQNLVQNPSFREKNYPSIKEALDNQFIRQMNTRGWTVKTRSYLIIFNNEYSGIKLYNPSLSNGFIEASEIVDQNILALYTAYHAKPYAKEFINGLEAKLKNIVYIHCGGDARQGNKNEIHLHGFGEKRC